MRSDESICDRSIYTMPSFKGYPVVFDTMTVMSTVSPGTYWPSHWTERVGSPASMEAIISKMDMQTVTAALIKQHFPYTLNILWRKSFLSDKGHEYACDIDPALKRAVDKL